MSSAVTPLDPPSPREILNRVYGFPSFRPGQEEIIDHLVGGGSALVVMPTGGGKSLCYQIPAIARPGTGIIVSPLIALMRDQVVALRQLGVRAECLNSSLEPQEAEVIRSRYLKGDIDVLYLSPERIMIPESREFLKRRPISLFAVDEAHCISQWGHDFRPEYGALGVIREEFPGTPLIALTATADEPTRADIIRRLGLADARKFYFGFDRPNIRYRISLKNEARKQLLDFLEEDGVRRESGIIYCLSRKRVDELAAWLPTKGYPNVVPYHAGLAPEVRQANQDRFINDEGIIVVATIAFGMGIDKPNVRFVAHLDLPKSIESYYQETGRAGRDGLPSVAWMAYGLADVVMLKQMIQGSEADEEKKRLEQRKLNALLGLCESSSCRRVALLRYFGEERNEPCGNCDNCLTPTEQWEGTVAAQKVLSAVYRTGQRFGAGYIVQVLRGEDDDRMRRFGHDKLPTFGVGKDIEAPVWMSVIRQLVSSGALTVDMEGYGSLLLGPDASEIMKGNRPIHFRRDMLVRPRRDRKRRGGNEAERPLEGDQALFERLRAKRLEVAKEANVPPYVIFHDTTLTAMAARKPRTTEELRAIPGVGDSKIAKYGDIFLRVIEGYESSGE